jgi:WD40 repeat protein
MSEEPRAPVVLLAFANDHGIQYLRNLAEEQRALRRQVEEADRRGLCQAVIRSNATVEDLFEVFQDPRYRDRTAIVHFAGHAGDAALLLERSGGREGTLHAAGFADFLGQQRGLQLVFLNACSTQPQVDALLAAGVPAVIATSDEIDDQVALDVATRFYGALTAGSSIEAAWNESMAVVRSIHGDRPADLCHEGSSASRWPWDLSVREGADSVRLWTLSNASGNPLFGLPELPERDLPDAPFRHLRWFEEEEAELFFGRGSETRELYERATAPASAPVILFHGQSGVGKSSLLTAGLMPRLRSQHDVRYLRRSRERGLTDTLVSALGSAGPSVLLDVWIALEDELRRPVTVILDQAEEVFTRPRPEEPQELERFLSEVAATFGRRSRRPLGKLILSFRKEWLAEFDKRAGEHRIPRSRFFLDRIGRDGVIDAVEGPSRSDRLRRHYNLTIDVDLGPQVAADLLADPEAPVTPTLQVLLAKMWDQATRLDVDHPHFTQALYHSLRRQGLLLDDFLTEQLNELRRHDLEAVESGLALDLLAYHTTALGTTEQRTLDDLRRSYVHQAERIGALARTCVDRYVLVDAEAGLTAGERSAGTRLAHDTLAPLVQRRFKDSDAVGQRARRIVENRVAEWASGRAGDPLDGRDLATVEAGAGGMRAWTPDEQRLVRASRRARTVRRAGREAVRGAAILALVAIIWLFVTARDREREAFARGLATIAGLRMDQDPTLAPLGVLLAMESAKRLEDRGLTNLEATRVIRNGLRILARPVHPPARILANGVEKIGLGRGGSIAAISAGDSTVIADLASGHRLATIARGAESGVVALAATKDLVAIGRSGTGEVELLRVRDLDSAKSDRRLRFVAGTGLRAVDLDAQGTVLATISDDGVKVWGVADQRLVMHRTEWSDDQIYQIAVSADGARLAVAGNRGNIHLIRVAIGATTELRGVGVTEDLAFSPDGRFLAASGDRATRVWTVSDGREIEGGIPAAVRRIAFNGTSSAMAVANEDGVSIWALPGLERLVDLPTREIDVIAFHPSGSLVATGGRDRMIRVWSYPSGREMTRAVYDADILALGFDDSGGTFFGIARDGTVGAWSQAGDETIFTVAHPGVTSLALDTAGTLLLTSGGRSVRIWDLDVGRRHIVLRDSIATARTVLDIGTDAAGKRVAFAQTDAWIGDLVPPYPVSPLPTDTVSIIVAVAVNDAGDLIATGDHRGHVTVLRPEGQIVESWQAPSQIWDLDFGPGDELAWAAGDSVSFGVAGGAAVRTVPHLTVESVRFGPGGGVVTAGMDSVVRVRSRTNGAARTLPNRSGATSAALSRDGDFVAAGGVDGLVRIWSGSGELVAELPHEASVTAVSFLEGARFVVTASDDGYVRVWAWRLDDILAQACERVSRNLTSFEVAQYLGTADLPDTCPGQGEQP